MIAARSFGAYLLTTLICLLSLAGCGGGGESAGNLVNAGAVSGANAAEKSTDGALAASAPQASGDEAQPSLTASLSATGVIDPRTGASRLTSEDLRNGVYYVYAADGTNGSRQKLSINFDTMSYDLTDSLGQSTSGIFSEDSAEPGTYVFSSLRITSAVDTARFRVTADAIVGAFPFEKAWSSPVSYQVMPFIAARIFVTDPAQLDGAYNRFGVSRSSTGTSDSQILAMRISGQGTLLAICLDSTIYVIDSCPAVSKRAYALTSAGDFAWTGTNSTPGDVLQFRMARIGGQNVWLSGGYTDAAPDVHVFRVGLRDSSAWPNARYAGAATDGSWGFNVLDGSNSVRTTITPQGDSGNLQLPVGSIVGPQGIRLLNAGGTDRYFAMQNGILSVIVGTRNPSTQGYIQVNLLKDTLDSRSGRYTVFTTAGSEQTLDINFDTLRYTMTAPAGDTATGAFSPDANDPGTYVFASDRISTVVNTARFRTTTDAIVGVFPFAVFNSDASTYAAQPFIAARSFVTNRSELAGLYDVSVSAETSGNVQSAGAYWQLGINALGTIATQCFSGISPCQPPAVQDRSYVYSISPGASPDVWQLTNTSGNPFLTVHIAKIGTRKVLLQAMQTLLPAPGPTYTKPASMFVAGLAQPPLGSSDANWPTLNMHSVSTAPSFGTAFTDATTYTTHYVQPDGTSTDLTLTYQSTLISPLVRTGVDGAGAQYLLFQNGAIMFVVGAKYFHIGLAN